MSEALISDARYWANQLVLRESRGPGDTENAMRRIASRYGVDFGALWSLRYRPPPRIFADVYFALRSAYQAECERQLRMLRHDLELTKAVAGPGLNSVAAAEAVVGPGEGEAEASAG